MLTEVPNCEILLPTLTIGQVRRASRLEAEESGERSMGGMMKQRSSVLAVTLGAVLMVSSVVMMAGQASAGSFSAEQAVVAAAMKTPTKISQTVPLPEPAPKGKKLVFLVANNANATLAWEGAAAAAAAVGWKFDHIVYDPTNLETLEASFASALALHPTVVAESGLAQTQFGAATIKAYAKAGVPIIVAAATPVTPSKTILGPVQGATVFTEGGTILANWFVNDSQGTGSALVVDVPAFPVLGSFGEAFSSTVASLCSTCNVDTLDIPLSEVDAGQAVSAVVAHLQANPSIKYVFWCDSDFAIGITSALSAAGLTDVKVGSQLMDSTAQAAIQAGTEAVSTGFAGEYQGYAVVDMALRWVEHAPLGHLDALSPTQLFTSANISSSTFGGSEVFNAPSNALQQFEKLWKVKITK